MTLQASSHLSIQYLFQTKAALTRHYNKSSHKLHYSMPAGPVKRKRGQASAEVDVETGNGDAEASDVDSDEEVVKALKVVC